MVIHAVKSLPLFAIKCWNKNISQMFSLEEKNVILEHFCDEKQMILITYEIRTNNRKSGEYHHLLS